MPDPSPNPAPRPRRKSPGPIDAKTLASLTLAEKVAGSAQNPNFDAAFTHQQVAKKFITDYAKDVALARRIVARAIARSADRATATAHERAAKQALLATIREIQKQAKRKWESTDAAQLANYGVGEDLDSTDKITQAAKNIHARLTPDTEQNETVPADTLPTIDDAKIEELETRYADYTGEDLRQSKAQGGATAARGTLKDQMKSLNARRRQLQQAIDSEFPHDANGTRAEERELFGLDPRRPLT